MADTIEIAVQIVAAAGSAKSSFVEAIQTVLVDRDLARARALYEDGCKEFHTAHDAHMQILTMFADGQPIDANILLVHAECQLMSAEDFKILAGQAVDTLAARESGEANG